MADHIKFSVSVDVVDEITQTIAYTNDDDTSMGADVASTEYISHHDIPFTIGGSVSAASDATGGIEHAGVITGFTDGVPSYTLLAADGTKVGIGTTNNSYRGVLIKHTGYTDTNLDTRTYNYLAVFVEETDGGTVQLLFTIPSGGAVFLPHVRGQGSGQNFQAAASNDKVGSTSSTSSVLAHFVTIDV